MRVAIPRPPGDGFLDHLRARLAPGVTIVEGGPCEVLVAGRPERAELVAGLRAVVVPFAGVPAPTRELLAGFPGVALHNLHHNAAPVAETAVALLLAAAKRIVPKDRALRRGDWREAGGEPILDGRTALVLGYGAIGTRVAAACRALGMNVLAVRRGGTLPGAPVETFGPGSLHALLPRADALVV
jgi:phosphoglycerate dehydrogenase-like enzyme